LVATVSVLALALTGLGYDIWGALVVAPLIFIPVAFLAGLESRHGDPRLAVFFLWGFVARLAGSLVYFLIFHERADAFGYAQAGAEIGRRLQDGGIAPLVVRHIPGTGVIDLMTGGLFTLTGPTTLGAFVVFATAAFLGMLMFIRAFANAFPFGAHRRYAMLVCFFPSLVFWPSAIGKEAWILFCTGAGAWAASCAFKGRLLAWTGVAFASVGIALVRPHMAALYLAALAVGVLLFMFRGRAGVLRVVSGITVVGAGGWLAWRQVRAYFGLSAGFGGILEGLTITSSRTARGGSAIVSDAGLSPLLWPVKAFGVLFRPLPHEAHTVTALIASLEGALLLIVILASVRVLRPGVLVAAVRRVPYGAMALAYVLLFLTSFASISNFGILARQRVQILPFLFVLLCWWPPTRRTSR
jgi:hypothetical protein